MRRFEGRACFWEAEGRVLSKTPTHLRGGRVSPRVSPWKGHYYGVVRIRPKPPPGEVQAERGFGRRLPSTMEAFGFGYARQTRTN